MVTLYLIAANVYGTVEAPKNRGFSYIEVWMVGIQATILVALFEYALILALNRNVSKMKQEITLVHSGQDHSQHESHIEQNELKIALMDRYTEIGSAIFFILFNICYWLIATKN